VRTYSHRPHRYASVSSSAGVHRRLEHEDRLRVRWSIGLVGNRRVLYRSAGIFLWVAQSAILEDIGSDIGRKMHGTHMNQASLRVGLLRAALADGWDQR
jgi:hypothetical protein